MGNCFHSHPRLRLRRNAVVKQDNLFSGTIHLPPPYRPPTPPPSYYAQSFNNLEYNPNPSNPDGVQNRKRRVSKQRQNWSSSSSEESSDLSGLEDEGIFELEGGGTNMRSMRTSVNGDGSTTITTNQTIIGGNVLKIGGKNVVMNMTTF